MQPLSTPDQLQQAEAAFRRVFANANYTEPFVPTIAARLLLYPIDYTVLDRAQFQAISEAVRETGASEAYLAGFGGEEAGWGGTYGHRLGFLNDYDDYRLVDGVVRLEHFMFGRDGEWGVVTSDGEYALIGGGPQFAATVRDRLGYDEDAVVRSFVAEWRAAGQAGASVGWVPQLLGHVLGREEGPRRWAD